MSALHVCNNELASASLMRTEPGVKKDEGRDMLQVDSHYPRIYASMLLKDLSAVLARFVVTS